MTQNDDISELELSSDDNAEGSTFGLPTGDGTSMGTALRRREKSVSSSEEEDDREGGDAGEEEAEEYLAEGPVEWADVDEAELRHTAARLCSLGRAATATEAASSSLTAEVSDSADLLGLGRIDLRSLSLVPQNEAHSRVAPAAAAPQRGIKRHGRRRRLEKASEPGDGAAAPSRLDRNKVLPTGDRFDPEQYLAVVHSETPAEDLRHGVELLKRTVAERNSQLKDLVKDNFERFIGCKTTIDEIHERIRESESGAAPGAVSTQQLAQRVSELSSDAQSVFASLLERHKQVERVYSVVGLLKRFGPLFSLPTRIRQLADAQDHEAIIGEYRRARQLVGKNKEGIWSSLMGEVDKVVEGVVDELVTKLVTPSTAPEEALEAIENLLQLREYSAPGTGGERLEDPIGTYLETQRRALLERLSECAINHSCRMTSLRERAQEQARQETRWMELQRDSVDSTGSDRRAQDEQTEAGAPPAADPTPRLSAASAALERVHSGDASKHGEPAAPLAEEGAIEVDGVVLPATQAMLVRFEGRLSAVVVRNLAELWTAFSSHHDRKGLLASSLPKKARDLSAIAKAVCSSYKDNVKQLLGDMASMGKDSLAGLALVTRRLAQARSRLEASGASPVEQCVSDVGWAAAKHFVSQLSGLLLCPSAWLVEQETFEAMPRSCFTDGDPVSPLPVALAKQLALVMRELAALVREMGSFSAAASATAQAARERHIEQQVAAAFFGSMSNACDAVRKLATRLSSGSSSESSAVSSKEHPEGEEAQRLLLLRNNVTFLREHLMPAAADSLRRLLAAMRRDRARDAAEPRGPPELSPGCEALKAARSEMRRLADELLSTYCGMKESSLADMTEAYVSGLDQGGANVLPMPSGVRATAIEIVDALASIHAEVEAVAPSQLGAVLSKLARSVFSGISQSILSSQGPRNYETALQLLTEIRYLQSGVAAPLQTGQNILDRTADAVKKSLSKHDTDTLDTLETAANTLATDAVRATRFHVISFRAVR
eukprot:CAMPEP_0177580646 /NCGR_PEP_ID=MMETSP0419_2-20121207/1687_1 /TAXON_ID=582737 /ORGANISM="Tetraselmis sp., Strain GSL018" /LENGTH=1004 /DNA_ID=CAMNT_0019069559 /DNA_START=52 /DNA_END=3066 /DNA_ORIENTATION=+